MNLSAFVGYSKVSVEKIQRYSKLANICVLSLHTLFSELTMSISTATVSHTEMERNANLNIIFPLNLKFFS